MPDRVQRTYHCRLEEIDRLRLERGWNLEELSQKAGLHSRTLRRIMDGNPTFLKTINRLASKFNVSSASLIHDAPHALVTDKPARFKLHLQLQGHFRSGEHKDHLIRLTSQLIRSLAQEGIAVTAQKSTLATSRLSGGLSLWRVLIGFAALTDERSSWGLAAIIPSQLPMFLEARSFGIDGFGFGEIIATGWGRRVARSSIQRAARLYDCRPTDIVDLSARGPVVGLVRSRRASS